MATRAPFLTQPYGAYYHRDVPHEDKELTHVGPGTPCGEYLRRFWQPVALSRQVQELPLRVRLLGEDLVVFRDQSGQVGCLELYCPHRGTSLEFGLIAEKGIRSPTIPSNRSPRRRRLRLKHSSYAKPGAMWQKAISKTSHLSWSI